MDFKQFKPILKSQTKMEDPPRFPKLIVPIESEVKKDFALEMNKMIVDVTKKMIDITK